MFKNSLKIIICLIVGGLAMCSKSPVSVNDLEPDKMARVFISDGWTVVRNVTLKCEGNIMYQFPTGCLPDTFSFVEGKRISAHWKNSGSAVRVDTIAIDGMIWLLN